MDIRITRNDIREFNKVAVGYCGLQDALQFYDRIGYACGVYGWNYDYYSIGNVAIITGYRPEGKYADWQKVKRINDKAKELRDSWDYRTEDYNDFKERAKKVITPMIQELAKEV